MAEESKPNHNAAMIRNIIVGVATSVIGAASLYFLGINKSGQSGASSQGSFLEIKEATTKGWKSYVTADNIYYKNTVSIYNDLASNKKLDIYQERMLKEVHKFTDDLESILKDQSLDNSFASLLKRRLETQKEIEEKFTVYIGKIRAIMDDNTIPQDQRTQNLSSEDQNYDSIIKGILERAITEIEDISKTLADKYGQSFSLADVLIYQDYKKGTLFNDDNTNNPSTASTTTTPQLDNGIKPVSNIPPEPSKTTNYSANNTTNQLNAGMYAGEWTNEGGSLYFDNKGFSWEWNDGKVTSEGSWRVENYQLTMYVTKGYNTGFSWTFSLSDVTPTSFTMQLTNNSTYTYHMVKYNDK
ncbi:MAG: hypothetical protein WDO19_16325 [Bacteroidota bacterium]